MQGLADVMGAAGLAGYAVIALLLFFVAFLLVAWKTYAPSQRARHDRDALLPFEDSDTLPETRETTR